MVPLCTKPIRPIGDAVLTTAIRTRNIDPAAGGFLFETYIVDHMVTWLRSTETLDKHPYFNGIDWMPDWLKGATINLNPIFRVVGERTRGSTMTIDKYYRLSVEDLAGLVFVPRHLERTDAIFTIKLATGSLKLVICQFRNRKKLWTQGTVRFMGN